MTNHSSEVRMLSSACAIDTYSNVVFVLKKSSINSFHSRDSALRFRDEATVSTTAEEYFCASAATFSLRSMTILWHKVLVFSMQLVMWSSRFVSKSKYSLLVASKSLLVASKLSILRVSLDISFLCCAKHSPILVCDDWRSSVASDFPSVKRFTRKSTHFCRSDSLSRIRERVRRCNDRASRDVSSKTDNVSSVSVRSIMNLRGLDRNRNIDRQPRRFFSP